MSGRISRRKIGLAAALNGLSALCLALWLLFAPAAALAQNAFSLEPVLITAKTEQGFGRIIITFKDRFDLPPYEVGWDNGVLVVTFDRAVNVSLPDMSGDLAAYVTAARLDPDRKGIRIGLNGTFKVSKTEAGESLYVDILPENWQGIEPGLPREVVEELSRRSRDAALKAEQQRKAEYVRQNQPTATVRVGRHESFVRMLINWDIGVKATHEFTPGENNESTLRIDFDWPVPVDLYPLKSDLPPEVLSAINMVDEKGSHISIKTQNGLEPRFYALSESEFIVDFDIGAAPADAVDLASLLPEGDIPQPEAETAHSQTADNGAHGGLTTNVDTGGQHVSITPYIENVGSTVRMVFPFEHDTASAVFRRGNVLWMVFDTDAVIGEPADKDAFAQLASAYSALPAGGTTIVRMNLETARLATLASEGRAWVLSLGDNIMTSNELISLNRRQMTDDSFQMTADMDRPAKVHQLRDPEIGDVLEVVTAYPPARGIVRDLEHVDFTALRSLNGLVVEPHRDDVAVDIELRLAVISAPDGLHLSNLQQQRQTAANVRAEERGGFIDLKSAEERDPAALNTRLIEAMNEISEAENRERDAARFNLAKLYLANDLAYEAIGTTQVLRADLVTSSLDEPASLMQAAAQTLAGRPAEALKILNSENMTGKSDAMIWRTIARFEAGDSAGARRDALIAEPSIDSYPHWIRQKFLMAGIEAALSENDVPLAKRLLGLIETANLDETGLTRYENLSARLDEEAGRFDEALDGYGRVIAADIRPTRAEAIYRTLLLLDKMGRLDLVRAADTLASEVLTWRGNPLEAKMLKLLSELYFRNGDYRNGFETVNQLALAHPEEALTREIVDEAQKTFADLYLNGKADVLAPVDALTLYYDYRNLTPTGARGDEMVRNLARRLIKFDLLEQAGELLQYQIDNRLQGAARAQIAADLAIVYLAQRRPEKALASLSSTRVAGLAPSLERQRRILEARALIDAGREDLAIDILSVMDGQDANLLRVDAHWKAGRYQAAAEVLERLYSSGYQLANLSATARQGVVKSAVGFVLAGDAIGITRLRERFAQSMAQTPEWALFNFVTSSVESNSLEFRKVAQDVAGGDSLNAFLSTYQLMYGSDGALSPVSATAAPGA